MTPMPNSRGGSVLVFAARIATARGPRLLPMRATSAACMWLGYRGAYVHPKARFGFHAIRRDFTGIAGRIYRAHLRAAHPDLAAWYQAHADDSDRLVWLTGRQLIERGWARPVPHEP